MPDRRVACSQHLWPLRYRASIDIAFEFGGAFAHVVEAATLMCLPLSTATARQSSSNRPSTALCAPDRPACACRITLLIASRTIRCRARAGMSTADRQVVVDFPDQFESCCSETLRGFAANLGQRIGERAGVPRERVNPSRRSSHRT